MKNHACFLTYFAPHVPLKANFAPSSLTLAAVITSYLILLLRSSRLKITHRTLISFSVGTYFKDTIYCDIALMDACHLILGRTCSLILTLAITGRRTLPALCLKTTKSFCFLVQNWQLYNYRQPRLNFNYHCLQ